MTDRKTLSIKVDATRLLQSMQRAERCAKEKETWLQSIRSNPSDWQAMLVFADWLEEEGDLLAAEQWRWIAATHRYWRYGLVMRWPRIRHRQILCQDDTIDIRCMPTYPLTIEDVQAYLETAVRAAQ